MTDLQDLSQVVLRGGKVVSRLSELARVGGHDLRLLRDPANPTARHLLSDVEGSRRDPFIDDEARRRLIEFYRDLPDKRAINSVALFFNLSDDALPAGYAETERQDVLNWLDEGVSPATIAWSDFLWNYWNALSYGHWALGVTVPRGADGDPLIPTVVTPSGGAEDWGALIRSCFDTNAEAIWVAGGSHERDGKRWIASVVLVQRYGDGCLGRTQRVESHRRRP